MRCSGSGSGEMKEYTMEFKGSDFTMIGTETAAKIDGATVRLSGRSEVNMQKKVAEERHHKLIFKLEF